MTVAAALSYGELSAMFPKAGGQYTYITEIFGKKTRIFVRLGNVYRDSNRYHCSSWVAFGKFSVSFPALNDAAPLFQSGEFKIT